MNKGKENYQNIPLPDGLSDAVRKGIKKGKRPRMKRIHIKRPDIKGFFTKVRNLKKEDISDMIDYLYFHFPDLYAEVRKNVHKYEDLASYWVQMFSLFVEFKVLDGHAADVQDFREVDTKIGLAKLEDWREAYIWLKIGYDHCNNERILREIANNLVRLKKQLNTFVYEQLFATVIDFAKEPSMLAKLLRTADTPFKPRLQKKLAEASGATPWLRDFFPFNEWEEETVKKAIKQMVGDGKFPVAEIAKLTEPLQQYAMKCMEVRSQMLSLKKDVSALLKLNIQLYPEVEMRLYEDNIIKTLIASGEGKEQKQGGS